MKSGFIVFTFVGALGLPLVGCGSPKSTARPPETPVQTTDAKTASATTAATRNVAVAEDLARLCNIVVGNADRAPKFDFDNDALLPEDRSVLSQIATCVTTGPL